MRNVLKNKIKELYITQDRCAYTLHINNSILSRIINCTKDPSATQIYILCGSLGLTEEEVLRNE